MNIILSLFQWILDVGFRASLLSIAVLLLQAALRPVISARARYLLWLPVLLVLLLPILPRSRWSAENLFTSHTHASSPVLAPSTVTVIEEATPASHVASAPWTDWKQSAAALIWAGGAALSLAGGLAEGESFMQRMFRGATKPLLIHFATNAKLSPAEVKELKKLLDQSTVK